MIRNHPPFLPLSTASVAARIEAMRARGMSATAIRRALGLSATELIAYGLVWPGPRGARVARARARETTNPNPRRTGLSAAVPRQADGAGPSGPRMVDVVDAVARACGLGRKELLGRGQTQPLARARHLAMHLLRELCPGASLPAIGYLLNRDHTTVLYGCRRAEARLARDTAFRTLRERLRRGLAS